MYVRKRVLTKATKGAGWRTPYEVLYDVKLELADLCAFGALCAIVGRIGKWADCGLSYEHQPSACDIRATSVHI